MNHITLLTLLNSSAYEMGYLFGKIVGFVGVGVLIFFLIRRSRK